MSVGYRTEPIETRNPKTETAATLEPTDRFRDVAETLWKALKVGWQNSTHADQNPEDFAASTGMNARAGEQGFFGALPRASAGGQIRALLELVSTGQPVARAGRARLDRRNDAGDGPAALHGRRVYIAGLSAGGAMAAIDAAAYPDVSAAVGVHSGLAPGATTNLPDALAAMRGDQDRTVHPRNGEQVIAAAMESLGTRQATPEQPIRSEEGVSAGGQSYTRIHYEAQGHAMIEHWSLHGARHAWSGGYAEGSYTDANGPDATGELFRFFFAQSYGPAGQ